MASRRARGFGLVELMITIVVMTIVMVAVFRTFFSTSDESQRVSRLVDARQSARLAIQLIERDTRMAGSGWGRAPVFYSDNGTPKSFRGIDAGFSGDHDSLTLSGAWSATTTLRAALPDPSAVIKCTTTSGFAAGDLCVISNGTSAHMFQVTLVTASPADLQHSSASPYNVSGGFSSWPAGGYGTGAVVFRISRATYRVDSTNFGRPCLVRQEFGQLPQVAAWDVAGFRVEYREQDGTWTRSPSSMNFVDRVRPVIVMRVAQARSAAWEDSCWGEIRPRTF